MENNSSQESHVEGKVNDQQVKTQKGGFKSRYLKRIKVKNRQLELREDPNDQKPKFKAYVGEGRSVPQYIRTSINHGYMDDELDNVTSDEDLKKIVDKLLAERGEEKSTNKFSKKSVDELLLDLADILEALNEKTGKSPAELCADAQEAWEQREDKKDEKEEEELTEALQKIKERRAARQESRKGSSTLLTN